MIGVEGRAQPTHRREVGVRFLLELLQVGEERVALVARARELRRELGRLLQHAFDTLGAAVVGWRTDHLNFKSQQAITRLGARFDGRVRHHAIRRDGTIRDTMFYSLMAGEWPDTRAHLLDKLRQHGHVA